MIGLGLLLALQQAGTDSLCGSPALCRIVAEAAKVNAAPGRLASYAARVELEIWPSFRMVSVPARTSALPLPDDPSSAGLAIPVRPSPLAPSMSRRSASSVTVPASPTP